MIKLLQMMFVVAVVGFFASAYLVPSEDKTEMTAVKYELKINGTAPGEVELRVRNSIDQFINCAKHTLTSDGVALTLTQAGEEFFDDPEGVQAAIDEALANLVEDWASTDPTNGRPITMCAKDCGILNFPTVPYSAMGDGIEVYFTLWCGFNGPDLTTEDFDADPDRCRRDDDTGEVLGIPLSRTLIASIYAKRRPGVNLRAVLEQVHIGYTPLDEVVAEILSGNCTATVEDQSATIRLDSGGATERYVTVVWFPDAIVGIQRKVDGVITSATALYGFVDTSGNTVDVSSYDDSSSSYTDLDSNTHSMPDAFPSSFTIENVLEDTPAQLNGSFNMDVTDPPGTPLDEDIMEPNVSGGMTDYYTDTLYTGLLASAGTWKIKYIPTKIKNSLASNCQWDATYVNRRPFLKMCGENEMQLNVFHPNGFKHPIGRFPDCRITNLKAQKTDAET